MKNTESDYITVRLPWRTGLVILLLGLVVVAAGYVFHDLLKHTELPGELWVGVGVLCVFAGCRVLLLRPVVLQFQVDGINCANERRFFPWDEISGVRLLPGYLVLQLTVPMPITRAERALSLVSHALSIFGHQHCELPEVAQNEHLLSTNGWDTDVSFVAASIRKVLDFRAAQSRAMSGQPASCDRFAGDRGI